MQGTHLLRDGMRIAAYQAPITPFKSRDAIDLIRDVVSSCEEAGVSILCCPEAVVGGLADSVDEPEDMAINCSNGELEDLLGPLESSSVTTMIGFTETRDGRLYNAVVVFHKGAVHGLYRKLYPGVNRSIYDAGSELPVFHIEGLDFGILICNDSNYVEASRILARRGASVIFVPTNNAMRPEIADVVTAARNTDIARAIENGVWIVRADVSGERDGLISYGTTAITDPAGRVEESLGPHAVGTIIADLTIDRAYRPRGWDAIRNQAVVDAYLETFRET